MKHTPEPWNWTGTKAKPQDNAYLRNSEWESVLVCFDSPPSNADAARIVATVNAMAGIEDPAAALKAARDALKLASNLISEMIDAETPGSGEAQQLHADAEQIANAWKMLPPPNLHLTS